MNLERLDKGYIETADWKPFPQIDDRAAWQQRRNDPRLALPTQAILNYAEQVLDAEVDPLTATMYMDFMRNGDRLEYETHCFRRRVELSHLVMAECLTAEGRYLDRIIDYIWAILGEIYWCVPAHNFAGQHEMVMHKEPNPWNSNDPLPVPDDEYLDLFNCETAAILAEACYLLKPVLLETVPSLYYLVHRQIEQRTLAKLEGDKLYGWYHGKNNWTVWCAHNLLLAACYVVDDKSRLITIANKLLLPMQRFFDHLEDSGSCIEGPTYWVVSAGRLTGFIDLIEDRFQLDLGFADNNKFRNFGEHIVKLHIGEHRFVNFADGALEISLDHGLLSRLALKIDAQALASLISEDMDRVALRKLNRNIKDRSHNDFNRQILIHLTRLLFWTPDLSATAKPKIDTSIWLEDMQVMIARQYDEAGKGLAVSCIAGSNDPKVNHHSHNDIGQFSVYLNGAPMIIDLGQGSYTKETFGENRYAMWHISSEGHNVPKINGLLQRPGPGTDAADVCFSHQGSVSRLSFNAAPAYFEVPGNNAVRRSITFDRAGPGIIVEDRIDLDDPLSDFEFPLHLCCHKVTPQDDDTVRIEGEQGTLILTMANLKVDRVEAIQLTDPRHREIWGNTIQKLCLKPKDTADCVFSIEIKPEQ